MDNRYLQYILVLAETGNMTRAAEKLFVSQPTLSQFLTRQEQEIGMPLFQRNNGIFTLTPAGNLYAEYAKTVLQLTDKLECDLQNLSNTSRIYIGTSSSKAVQMLSSILVHFRETKIMIRFGGGCLIIFPISDLQKAIRFQVGS